MIMDTAGLSCGGNPAEHDSCVHRSSFERVVLGLGSNCPFAAAGGECQPPDLLRAAFTALSAILADAKMSSIYRTKAMYVCDQADFYNAVVIGVYSGSPRQLLHDINAIEARFGRDRAHEVPKGPRTLDIDIELFGTRVITEADLVIPHQLIKERAFVLVPLLELLPKSADPITGMCFTDILEKLPDQGVIRFS